jgi:hypothetical protein
MVDTQAMKMVLIRTARFLFWKQQRESRLRRLTSAKDLPIGAWRLRHAWHPVAATVVGAPDIPQRHILQRPPGVRAANHMLRSLP